MTGDTVGMISVRFDAELEELLTRLAARKGSSRSAVLREAIEVLAQREGLDLVPEDTYARVEDLLGSVTSEETRLSERTGDRVRKLLKAKREGSS